MVVVALDCPFLVLEANVVEASKGGTIDVGDLVVRHQKQLLLETFYVSYFPVLELYVKPNLPSHEDAVRILHIGVGEAVRVEVLGKL